MTLQYLLTAFLSRKASYGFIEAIEPTTVHMIHYNHLQSLYNEFIEFNVIGRLITEKYYMQAEARLHGMRKLKAEERLELLLQTQPETLSEISAKK